MLTRSKLNSVESKISEALINNETSHEDSMIFIAEEKKYRECKKDTKNINLRVSSTSNRRTTMILPKCAICGSKKSTFIKNQEAKGLLSNLGVRIPLSKVPILGNILF